jgi:hypothetical protein
VTVVFATTVTVQLVVLVRSHPLQLWKLFPLAVLGAVSVTVVPELYVSANDVLPEVLPLLSAGEAVTATPLAGATDETVSVYGFGVVVVELPPPPQAVIQTLIPTPTKAATFRRRFLIAGPNPFKLRLPGTAPRRQRLP